MIVGKTVNTICELLLELAHGLFPQILQHMALLCSVGRINRLIFSIPLVCQSCIGILLHNCVGV